MDVNYPLETAKSLNKSIRSKFWEITMWIIIASTVKLTEYLITTENKNPYF